MLINLSNHPSVHWSEEQKKASKIFGGLLDIPFPQVDAKADEIYISKLADEYFQKILVISKEEDIVVHLMGELTFTFALLKRLQKFGIRCIASTSKRLVQEESPGRKSEVIFQFERFREYI